MTSDTRPEQEGRPGDFAEIGPLDAEYQWCRQQQEIFARHVGQVVVFHNRTFLGSGADHHEALEDVRRRAAQEGRPLPAHGLLFLAVPETLSTDLPVAVLPDQ
jgi:hypothetical protein